MSPRPRLLWTDDDAPDRFEYEALVLGEEGWDVIWATSVSEAARLLADQHFDAMLLDQMLPYTGLKHGDPLWNGALLLRWLRGKGPPSNVTLDPRGELSMLKPRVENREIPTVVVSAFHDPLVDSAMRDASEQDRALPLAPKPIDVGALIGYLDQGRARAESRPGASGSDAAPVEPR